MRIATLFGGLCQTANAVYSNVECDTGAPWSQTIEKFNLPTFKVVAVAYKRFGL